MAAARDASRATRKLPVDHDPTGKLRWLNERADARLQQERTHSRGIAWVDKPPVMES